MVVVEVVVVRVVVIFVTIFLLNRKLWLLGRKERRRRGSGERKKIINELAKILFKVFVRIPNVKRCLPTKCKQILM